MIRDGKYIDFKGRHHPSMDNPRPLGYVYFFQAEESRYIKIGRSANLRLRLKTLQKCCSEKLSLIGLMRGDREKERELHCRFEHLCVRGEWFSESEELLQFIGVEASAELPRYLQIVDPDLIIYLAKIKPNARITLNPFEVPNRSEWRLRPCVDDWEILLSLA